MVSTNAIVNGGTTVVEIVSETVNAPSSDNFTYVKSEENGIAHPKEAAKTQSNGSAAKIVFHTNGASINGIAHPKDASNGDSVIHVSTNGAPQANGNAFKIMLHSNGASMNGVAHSSVNGALQTNGSAVKIALHSNGATTNGVAHPEETAKAAESAIQANTNGASQTNGIITKSVLHSNGAATNGASKNDVSVNGVAKSNEASKTEEPKSQEKKKSGRHAGVGHKTILQSEALNQYILETTVYPREHPLLKELRLMTAKHPWNLMLSPADEGQFLQVLLKLMNAKNTMEIGTYTGYSLLATALALPAEGKILALDLNRDCLDLGWPYIEKAGVANKITFRGGPALDTLDELLKDEKNYNFFDFVFVDADKNNYMNYHERLLRLVRLGGVIGYDNTLWNATVVASEEELQAMPKYIRYYQPFINELNHFLGQDPRVEPTLVSIGDGVTLCRRIL